MIAKEFMNALANDKSDIVQVLLDILTESGSRWCLIGGLAVNAYVDPVVSLDLDLVVAVENMEALCRLAQKRGLGIERFEHSVNLNSPASDLRVQLQTDPRYQTFIPRAEPRTVLGYTMNVAGIGDVLQGKVWAYLDRARRKSKRQKDLADIVRLVESYPGLESSLPPEMKNELEKL